LYIVRPTSTLTMFRQTTQKDRAVIDSLVPKGLAAAVLAQFPVQAGIPGTEMFSDIVLSAILISIVTSTIFIWLAQKNVWPGFTRIYLKILGK
ncbi:MAG: hypothetical protein KKE20_03245, partial [Nanoarchaeota archaeon]|nr:hypothetical protein [Nanoarchaeota archaeon]